MSSLLFHLERPSATLSRLKAFRDTLIKAISAASLLVLRLSESLFPRLSSGRLRKIVSETHQNYRRFRLASLNQRVLSRLALGVLSALWLSGCGTTSTSFVDITDFNTVVVDAGHGGHDSGAISRPNYRTKGRGRRKVVVMVGGPRVQEKDLALDVARRLDAKLRSAGFRTVMTRDSDRFVTLDGRVAYSNRQRKSVFVSIHFNDSKKRGTSGVEVYHNNRGSAQLARRISRALNEVPGTSSRGVMNANFRVLRLSSGPALLIECGFLSNPAEKERCATPAHRERLAEAIAKAIIAQRK